MKSSVFEPANAEKTRFRQASVRALGEDRDFLLKSDVFTTDVIETWIEYTRENIIGPL